MRMQTERSRLAIVAVALVFSCKSSTDSDEAKPVVQAETPAGVVVTLFGGPQQTLILAEGTLSARAESHGAELVFNGAVVGSCSLDVATGATVRSGHKSGFVFVLCDEGESVVVTKFRLSGKGASLKHIGWATAPANLEIDDYDALQFDAPAPVAE